MPAKAPKISVPKGSEWTKAELAEVRRSLVAELDELRAAYDDSMRDLNDLQQSGADGAGDDQADAGSKTFEREQEQSIAANRFDIMTQIQRAVERIDAGTYGYCESCGQPDPEGAPQGVPDGDARRRVQAARGAPLTRPRRCGTMVGVTRSTDDAEAPSVQRGVADAPAAADRAVRRRGGHRARPRRRVEGHRRRATRGRASGTRPGRAIYLDEARNSGAAFSLGTGFTVVLTLIAIAVVAVIIRTASRMRSAAWAVALGLVLGGALGNLGDRIFREPGVGRGHVVDWISLFGPMGEHWPIFNLADSAIVCGAILAALVSMLGIDLDGTRAGTKHDRA